MGYRDPETGLSRRARAALRNVLAGMSRKEAAEQAGIGDVWLRRIINRPQGKAYLDRLEREAEILLINRMVQTRLADRA